jgi:hypothetical protein
MPWGRIAPAVVLVAGTGLLILIMLRLAKNSERMEKDPKFRARKLRGGAILYGCSRLSGIVGVIRGGIPAWALRFALIPLMLIWGYIRAGREAKNSQINPNRSV